jgi:hypothetical protein
MLENIDFYPGIIGQNPPAITRRQGNVYFANEGHNWGIDRFSPILLMRAGFDLQFICWLQGFLA